MTQDTQYHDILIENEPLLMDRGFTKFSLPANGKATKMVLYNDKDHSMITYVDFDKHSLDNSVKLLHYKLVVEQQLETKAGKETVEGLVAYFRNIGHSLQEDPDSEFFKNGNGNDNRKEKRSKAKAQHKSY